MLPTLWFIDLYNMFILIGVVCALFFFHLYAKQINMDLKLKYTYLLVGLISIMGGLVFAILFQSLFDLLEGNDSRPFAMTFYGGLVGGVATFLIAYFFYIKKRYAGANITRLLIITPAAITVAHAFGRIGCFCAGCCYGIETDSWLGMQFPHLPNPVYPTQLFEALFLFALSGILLYLALKKHNKFAMPIYILSYGVWRFLIEFIRGDDRGAYFLSLSPSQWFSLLGIIGSVALFIVIKKSPKLTINEAEEAV